MSASEVAPGEVPSPERLDPIELVAPLAGRGKGIRHTGVRASRYLYHQVERSPLSQLLSSSLAKWLESRITRMPGDEVCVVLDGFDAVGVNAWLAGGWGVDALLGVQTRHHHDLDVVIANSDDSRMIVAGGLAALGYVMVREEKYEGLPMPVRWVFDDDRGHIVDIHPVDLLSRPFASNGHLGLPTFALGAVRDRAVRCLSASLQRELHTNYPLRAVDRRDLVRLIESEGRVLGEQCGEGTSEKL